MTPAATPVSRYLAPLLLGLSIVLAAGNWYLDPERVRSWAAALLFLACMAFVLRFALSRSSDSAAGRYAAQFIRNGVIFAALIMAVSLSVKLARALDTLDDTSLSQRLTMIILGAVFVFYGNAMPKMLTPLSVLRCDGASVQAFQRFTGWTWVLTGLAFAVVWLVLPPDVAEPVSVATMVGGALVVMGRVVGLRRTRHKEA
jgi:hypothetical protein